MKNKPTANYKKTAAGVLFGAAQLVSYYQEKGIPAFTVVAIYEADGRGAHETPAQQIFRSLFAGPEYWPLLDDGSWDWNSRIIALLLAAEVALEQGA